MCKAVNKRINNYLRLENTTLFIEELSRSTRIRADLLVQIITTDRNDLRGTWVHPQVAINLGQWLSPKFAVKVSNWVLDWMSGNAKTELPYHLRRYMANMNNVPIGYFSMLNEVTISLIAPMEQLGYVLPQNLLPDGSLGKVFSKHLRSKGHDVDSFPKYQHIYEDGRDFPVRAYPNEQLADLRKYFIEVWLKDKSIEYFKKRDENALPYLNRILSLPNYKEVLGFIDMK